jgi:predicted DNA-binding transcriptional regulator AlpA
MARSPHPKKEVEEALEHAEGQGWRVEVGGSHAWGRIYCPYNDEECRCGEFCITSVGVRRRTLATTHAPCGASWTTALRTGSNRTPATTLRISTMEYIFTLKYQLADDDRDLDALVECLGEAGCDDALVGIGQPGRLALEFTREADNADAAVRSALIDVRRAVPSATLIEVAPDLVGLTDVAELIGVSRQNMRKLMLTHPGSFPAPVHEGSASIWHLADVLTWLQAKGSYSLTNDMLEVASVALQVNVAKEGRRLSRSGSEELKALVG